MKELPPLAVIMIGLFMIACIISCVSGMLGSLGPIQEHLGMYQNSEAAAYELPGNVPPEPATRPVRAEYKIDTVYATGSKELWRLAEKQLNERAAEGYVLEQLIYPDQSHHARLAIIVTKRRVK